ncbi:amino acid permease [Candidatus Dependentiae bacterium]|nr:amino acid permease [Candidatus Dependentiae bacterium]
MTQNKIGLKTAVIIGINAMIGAGVLAIPTLLSSIVGPAGIITTVLSIIFVLCIGLSFGRLAKLYSADGWSYAYPAKWAGHKVGIFSAFSYLFGIIVGMGFLAQQAGIWCNKVIPFLSPNVLGVIIITILTLLVLAGAKTSSWSQYLIVLFVLIPLVLTAIYCWGHFDINLVTPFMPYGFTSILRATPVVLFALLGFESIASLFSIVENPEKNVPRAFVFSISIVGIVYLLFFYGVLFAIPSKFFLQGINDPLSSVLNNFFPGATFLSILIFLGAVFGIVGTIHSMLWSISELFTNVLKQTKSKFIHKLIDKNIWNKKVAVIKTSFLMILAAIFIKGGLLVSMTTLFIVPSYVFSIILLLFKKSEWKSGHNYITLIGLLGGGLLVYFAFTSSLSAFFKLFA